MTKSTLPREYTDTAKIAGSCCEQQLLFNPGRCFLHYEIYIDQFFAEQLLVGYLLLDFSVWFIRAQVSWKRIFAGSLANAVLETAALAAAVSVQVVTSLYWNRLVWPAAYTAGFLLAAQITFGGQSRRTMSGRFPFLLLISILFGGSLETLIHLTGLATASAAVLVSALLRMLVHRKKQQERKQGRGAVVTVTFGENQVRLSGMVDTGNLLKEPLTGAPVSIVDRSAVENLLEAGWQEKRGFFLIPFHSIGTRKGWLQAVLADQIEVCTEDGINIVKRPILALYDGKVSAKTEYRVILHPQHAGR